VWKAENDHKKNLIDPRSIGDRSTKIRFKHTHDMQTNTGDSFYNIPRNMHNTAPTG
jgi:hypothetical protein